MTKIYQIKDQKFIIGEEKSSYTATKENSETDRQNISNKIKGEHAQPINSVVTSHIKIMSIQFSV